MQSSISSKDDAADCVEMSAEFQLHQHAVDLIGLGGEVFEEQDRACGLDLVGRAERGDQDRQASAVQDAFRFAFDKGGDFLVKRNIPRDGFR